jgi:hypothetical protein
MLSPDHCDINLEIKISKYNAYSEYYKKLSTKLIEESNSLNKDAQAYCLPLASNGLLLGLLDQRVLLGFLHDYHIH